MTINGIFINSSFIERIEQDNESLHIIIKDEVTDEQYEDITDKLSVLYPEIYDPNDSIMWYPITSEKFIITLD